MTPTRQSIINELVSVLDDRSAAHGDAVDNFTNLAAVWDWWLSRRGYYHGLRKLNPEDAAVMCALAKIARMLSPCGMRNIDNWIDAAGYAICGAEIARVYKEINETTKA